MPVQDAQALIRETSAMNIDDCVKTAGFSDEVEEVPSQYPPDGTW